MKKSLLLLIAALIPTRVMAADWITVARVIQVEVGYIPDVIPIYIDKAAGSCPVNSPIFWRPRGSELSSKIANAQSVLSTIITARLSNLEIMVMGNNQNCNIDFIYLK